MPPPNDPERPSLPDALFAEVISILDAADEPSVALDAVVARHPEHAAAIRAVAEGRASVEDRATQAVPPAAGDAQNRVESTATDELMARLESAPKFDLSRYQLEGEVDRGGFGAVLRIHDRHLNRRLAMKLLLDREAPRDDYEQQLARQLLGRFLEEAQVTSQLEHPGIVPVHELGLDANGKVFFTMRLVRGRTAHAVFADAHAGTGEWTVTRALEVLLKVCDTMAFAHDKGVLHRDLKPANVMVGRFGEVYVMDWGLAKVVGQRDRVDLRIRPAVASALSQVDSARQRDAEGDASTSVVSMDGQKLGTPSYMPPEQARSEELDLRADVYAIGAMLYELLTGRAPYTAPAVRKRAYRILEDVVDGPPKRVEELASGVPAELVAIVEKAMARKPEARYPNTSDLAADVRAFLAKRVVKAYRTGAIVEMRLWMRRNKVLAAALVAIVLSLAAGIVGTKLQADEASRQQLAAEYNLRRFDAVRYRALLDEATEAAAAIPLDSPHSLVAIEKWLLQYEQLGNKETVAAVELARQQLATIEVTYLAPDGGDYDAWLDSVARLNADTSIDPNGAINAGMTIESPDPTYAFLRRMVDDILAELDTFCALDTGLLAQMKAAKQRAITLRKLTPSHPNARVTWDEARAAIAKADGIVASKLYEGQDIPLDNEDIRGLVPIGMNPQSKLWEFYDLRSAWDGEQDPATLSIPSVRADGRYAITGATGVVLVLVPGGTLPPGATLDSDYDGARRRLTVPLDPFFLGKYEVTQGQWLRWTGSNPTVYDRTKRADQPVNNVAWLDADTTLRGCGLTLPSELQWEYTTRAGTATPWWSGEGAESILANENLGTSELLPVGSRNPNGFGFFDTIGNVAELCTDPKANYGSERSGDGRRDESESKLVRRTLRGSSLFASDTDVAQSTYRAGVEPTLHHAALGVRAARPLHPTR